MGKRIIPCLDVRAGRVVKGVRFRDLREVGLPWEAAATYEDQGADEIVYLEVDASQRSRSALLETIEKTAEVLSIPLTVGGGFRTVEEISSALRAGADKVSVNTAAVFYPALIQDAAAAFGSQCVVVAIDAKATGAGWEVYTHGGTWGTRLDALEWARAAEALGAGEILLTSMDADGRKEGYNLELTEAVASRVGVPVVASGGCGHPRHMVEVFQIGADAALAASIFHHGEWSVADVKAYLAAEGIAVRPWREDGGP